MSTPTIDPATDHPISDYPTSDSPLVRFLYPAPARRTVGGIFKWWEKRRYSSTDASGLARAPLEPLFPHQGNKPHRPQLLPAEAPRRTASLPHEHLPSRHRAHRHHQATLGRQLIA